MPVEADRGGVVAEFAVAGLVDRAGEAPDELRGLEIGLFSEHGGHTAIAELPLAAPMSLQHGHHPLTQRAITYASRRRWPGPGFTSRIVVRPGESATAGPLEHFLTARWGLHTTSRGRAIYWPNEHRQWPLHAATLLELDDELLAAAGFADLAGVEPASVLFSPGVEARFGPRVRT